VPSILVQIKLLTNLNQIDRTIKKGMLVIEFTILQFKARSDN
jgi:hypothetical protein